MNVIGELWYKNRFIDNTTNELIFECVNLLKVTPRVGEIVGLKNCLYAVEKTVPNIYDVKKDDSVERFYVTVDIHVRFLRERDGL